MDVSCSRVLCCMDWSWCCVVLHGKNGLILCRILFVVVMYEKMRIQENMHAVYVACRLLLKCQEMSEKFMEVSIKCGGRVVLVWCRRK